VGVLAIFEPLGMRFFGVEIRETELFTISSALKETFKEHPLRWHEPPDTLEKIADVIIKFCDSVMEDEKKVLDSDPRILRELLSKSGAEEYKVFFKEFLGNLSKRKTLVKMLSGFSTVSIGVGSVSVRYRDRVGKVEELKINLKKMWEKVKERTKEIKNSFRHLAELMREEAGKTIVHIGIYAAALALIIISLWFSIAYNIASGLSTVASSVVNALKAAFPVLSFIVWLFCTLITIAEGYSKAKDAFEAIQRFLT
jgi:hypothetical protein